MLQEAALRLLERVVEALEREGIPALPVKGVVSSRVLYDDPSERPLRDVDVRVAERDYDRLCALARREGWHVLRRAPAYRNLIVEIAGMQIDFECHVGPPGLSALTVDAMLARAHRGPRGWREPDPVDHAVLMIVNVFKDKLTVAAPWAVEDLRRIARKVDPSALAARAREAKNETIAWIVADWMAREQGDDAWRAIRDALGPRPRRRLYAKLLGRLLEGPTDALALRLLARAGADDWRMMGKALARAGRWQLGAWVNS